MDLWNQVDLLAPPTFTFKAENQDLDLLKLRNALLDAINHIKDQGFLASEAALLSRITYRMKMKFRSAKDFKSLEKVSHALDRYFKCMNINSYFKLLMSLTPKEYQTNIYLPTRNMFSYILVKLQGLAKLMERIHDSCKIAAYLTNKRMSIGHFWKLSAIVFALISRIYVLVKYNCQFICDLYAKLYSHSTHLQNPGAQWLPKGYELPTDLRIWLGVQWVYEEEYVDLTNETLPKILNFFDLCSEDEEDIEFSDEYILIDEDNELNDFRNLKQKKLEKSGLFKMVPKLTKAEKRQKAIEFREHKKQARKERQRQTMRGFSTDIDCGEVITIDESLNEINRILDTKQLDIIKKYNEFKQAGTCQAKDEVLDEYFFNDDGDNNDDVVQESGCQEEIITEKNRYLKHAHKTTQNTKVDTKATSDIRSHMRFEEDAGFKMIKFTNDSVDKTHGDFSSENLKNNTNKHEQNNEETNNIKVQNKVDKSAILLLDNSVNKTFVETHNYEPILVSEILQNTLITNNIQANNNEVSENYASDKNSIEVIVLSDSDSKPNLLQSIAKSKNKHKSKKSHLNKSKETENVSKDNYTNFLKKKITTGLLNNSQNNSVSTQLKKKRTSNDADLDLSESKNIKKIKLFNKLVTSTPIKMYSSEKPSFNISTIITKKDKKEKKKELDTERNNAALAPRKNKSSAGNSTIKNMNIIKNESLFSLINSSSLLESPSNKKVNKTKNKKVIQIKNKLENVSNKNNFGNNTDSKKCKKAKVTNGNSNLDNRLNESTSNKPAKRKGHFANKSANPKKKNKSVNKSIPSNSDRSPKKNKKKKH